ncbi:MAG: phosphatase PAP2 family protein [Clostridia bacterium]|nr:phosphatase PAP2 family protein [Clostridia bacterium]
MDIDILLALQNFRNSVSLAFNGVVEALRTLGEPVALMAVACVLLWGVDKKSGYYIMLNCAWGLIINQFIKITACVYRPWVRDARLIPAGAALDTATGYSFPSAHTTIAVAMWGGMGVNLGKRRRWLLFVGVGVSLIIAFSRMYVGVHTPQDVLVSAVIGIALLWATQRVMEWIERNPGKDGMVAATGMALAAILAVYAAVKSYPMDYAASGELLVDPEEMKNDVFVTVGITAGFFAGWLIERRFIKYSVSGTLITRIIRVAIGFAILMALLKTLGPSLAFLGMEMANIVTYAALILFATVLYPIVFTKAERIIKSRRKT